MRCLCYGDCVCGTPVIDINPEIETFAEEIRSNELQRVNKRFDFLRIEGDLPARRGNDKERPTGLRYLLWELLIIIGPMNGHPSKGSLKRVPDLMKAVMGILITYHSTHFPPTKDTPQPRAFHEDDYNLNHQAEVSFYLCVIGNSLRFHPNILARLVREVPEFEDLVAGEEPPRSLPFQEDIIKAHFLARNAAPTLAEREHHLGQCLILELFSPYHQWLYLIAPVWIEWIDEFEDEPRESKMESPNYLRIAQTVTSHIGCHFIWGYSTLESMMLGRNDPEDPLQNEKGQWCRSTLGTSFPGLILALLTVSRPDIFCRVANEALKAVMVMKHGFTDKVMLESIFLTIIYHFDRDERMGRIPFHDYGIAQYYPIVTLLWMVAHDPRPEHALTFFDRAATRSWYSTLFVYLNRKTLRSRSKSISWFSHFGKYRELYEEYGYRPRGRHRRYFGALFYGAEQNMEVLERIGCMNWECKTRVRLETIKKRMNEEGLAVQDLAAEDKRLLASFKKVKLCSRCHNVAYCSRECQKAYWASHRPFCRRPEKDMTRNAEESAELIQRGWTANDEGIWPPYLLAKVGLDTAR